MLAAAVAIGLALAEYRLNSPQPANIRLAPGGVLRAWLVAGPFPNAPDDEGKTYGLATQWIGTEANARPVEGKYITRLRDPGIPEFWRLTATERDRLNFSDILNGEKPGVAYAYATLIAAHACTAVLLVEGAETVRVVLNGKRIFEGGSPRGGSTRLATHLEKGANRLLVKVVHSKGGWYQKLKVLAQPGIFEQLDVYRTGAHAEPPDLQAVRAERNKSGALDVDAAVAYRAATRLASQWIEVFDKDVPHPRILRSVISEAARQVIAAQGRNADAITAALRRGANMVRLAFRQTREQAVARFKNPGPLMRTTVAREDYVRVSVGKRYLVHANGKPYVPIGMGLGMWNEALLSCDPGLSSYQPEKADEFFQRASESGLTAISLEYIDWDPNSLSSDAVPGGGFDSPEHTKWVDTLILLALKHQVKLLVNGRFYISRYTPAGAEQAAHGFSREWLADEKQHWRAIVDRWGNSGAILAWEMDEPPDWTNIPAKSVANGLAEIADFIRKYEKRRWGRNHLIAIRIWKDVSLVDAKFRAHHFDFDLPLFDSNGSVPDPATSTVAAKFLESARLSASRELVWRCETYDDSETTGVAGWLALTCAGAGVLINSYPTDAALPTYLSLREFSLHIDWKMLDSPKSAPIVPTAPVRWIATGFGNAKAAILWAGGPTLGDRVVLPAKAPIRSGRYKAYDCSAGRWIDEGSFRGFLPIPKGLKSVAWVVVGG